MQKKTTTVGVFLLVTVTIVSVYVYDYIDSIPSTEQPDYIKEFANGRYEVRSFTEENSFCGYDVVVEVSTNERIYGARLCEANIGDVRLDNDNVVIVISSMAGEEEVVIPR